MSQLVNTAAGKCGLLPNVRSSAGFQVQHSLFASGQSPLLKECTIIEGRCGSIASDCTSSESIARPISRPMSISELSVGDENLSSGLSMGPSSGFAPQVYMQPAVTQPLVYDQGLRHNVPVPMPMLVTVPSPGYVNMLSPVTIPYTGQWTSNGIMMQPGSIAAPQAWAYVPISNAPGPQTMRDPVSYAAKQGTSYDPQSTITDRMSPNEFSSVMNTPIAGYCNSPCYLNSSGYYNTPLSCTSPLFFSPTQVTNVFPSVMTSVDVPPVFQLNNLKSKGFVMPNVVSCNINPVPDPSILQRHPPTVLPTAVTDTDSVRIRENNSSEQAGAGREERPAARWQDEDVWADNCDYKEYRKDGGSNLFITWAGSKPGFLEKLNNQELEVRHVLSTRDVNVYNTVFENHISARKAFITQREIRLRMVPPRNSTRSWFKNPSPKFLVKFETKFRLAVRSGKAECHAIVGEFLMSNFLKKKGCIIWADQLKGHRIRVVGCVGNFLLPNGKVVEMNEAPSMSGDKVSLGWVSYRCRHTREDFVSRLSGNRMGEYIYQV